MPLFTVKLTDAEHAELKGLAEKHGTSMAGLLRDWMRRDHGPRDTTHEACDQTIESLKRRLAVYTSPITSHPEVAQQAVTPVTPAAIQKPTFLAAPDEDCALCGHDRHAYHAGACTAPIPVPGKRPRPCGCPAFRTAGDIAASLGADPEEELF